MGVISKSKIKVMVVDDHELIRDGIEHLLKNAPGIEVISKAESGEDAIAKARINMPHVILMDIKMPGMGGLEATRKLRRLDPDVKILIVSTCDDDLLPPRLLQAGAAGYLTKGASRSELTHAIQAVHSGQRYISPGIANQLALRGIDGANGSPFHALVERELQVLLMVVKGMSAQEIGEQLNLSPKTINSYRYQLFDKLNVNNDVELTLLALRHGLIDLNNLDTEKTPGVTKDNFSNDSHHKVSSD